MPSIVNVTGLTKQFKNLTAVRDLSFSVNEGDVYGFLGQNGAGKSTTLRMLVSLIEPSAGEVEIFGKKLRTHRNEILREVGAVIEKPDVYKYLSAYENLKLFARLSGVKITNEKLMSQLYQVGLASRAKDTVKTFSQGMKQRLGIAIALVHDPKLIILDEPTNGLDPQGIADIRNLVLHLSKDLKKTLIISSHLLSEIEQVATRVLIIDKGGKIIGGNASELFDSSQTIVELQTFDNVYALQQLQVSPWNTHLQPRRDTAILIKLDRQLIAQLHRDMVNMNIQVLSLQPRHSLEDYFLQVTSGNQHVDTYSN
ncbi:MAG: ABC transporter ATP-binding protein [Sediminibacterium sp.]|nr:ABC transporter ATP-binding protein [Sediminibacterium sp.]